mgnify:CR=1 FL=1
MSFIYDTRGRIVNLSFIEHFVDLKHKSGSDPWPVIEECFRVWESARPTEYQSHLIYLNNIRETRKDKKFASSKDKVTGGYLRYLLDIPAGVMKMIRAIYSAKELPMDKEFFYRFGARFPKYRVAEKL